MKNPELWIRCYHPICCSVCGSWYSVVPPLVASVTFVPLMDGVPSRNLNSMSFIMGKVGSKPHQIPSPDQIMDHNKIHEDGFFFSWDIFSLAKVSVLQCQKFEQNNWMLPLKADRNQSSWNNWPLFQTVFHFGSFCIRDRGFKTWRELRSRIRTLRSKPFPQINVWRGQIFTTMYIYFCQKDCNGTHQQKMDQYLSFVFCFSVYPVPHCTIAW